MWKPPGELSEDFLYVTDIELIYCSHQKCFTKERLTTCYHFMYINVYHVTVYLSLNDFISAETLNNILYSAVIVK
jgi:hypothetical protein